MTLGRVLSTVAATVAVAGCAVAAVGMAHAGSRPSAAADSSPAAIATAHRPVVPYAAPAQTANQPTQSAQPAQAARTAHSSQPVPVRSSAQAPAVRTTASSSTPTPHASPTRASATHTAPSTPAGTTSQHVAPAPRTSSAPAPPRQARAVPGRHLPLRYHTGSATRVITVVAHSRASTTARLQAWTKVSGGWRKYGSSVLAHVGADGLGDASEYRSATPTGSYTLTRAFGYYSDPGTRLPYLHTTPADWWISQPGRLYNTHQHCSSGCSFTQGDPNEHLYYETPYYDYAVVIDYNTRNAPGGVHQGKGSAFFLHVTDGNPTAGCVAIPMDALIHLMRWLGPHAHPRILIGVT